MSDAVCDNCGSPREVDAVFCEVCGLDFATGKLPEAPPPPMPAAAPTDWLVLLEVDADFFEKNQSDDESLTLPQGVAAQEIPLRGDEALIGRRSASANVHPDIDLSSDPGVSRKHAVLKRSGSSWTVTDLGSTNGTRVAGDLLAAEDARPLDDGSVVHVGAWTRLTLKRAGGS